MVEGIQIGRGAAQHNKNATEKLPSMDRFEARVTLLPKLIERFGVNDHNVISLIIPPVVL